MAVLEAFVYDPLINWRLLNHASPKAQPARNPNATKKSAAESGNTKINND